MNTRFVFAAALALGLSATAPAWAASSNHTSVDGYNNDVDTGTRNGASLSTYVRGDLNQVKGRVAGPDTSATLEMDCNGCTVSIDAQ